MGRAVNRKESAIHQPCGRCHGSGRTPASAIMAATYLALPPSRWMTTSEIRALIRSQRGGTVKPTAMVQRLQSLVRAGLAESRKATRIVSPRQDGRGKFELEWRVLPLAQVVTG